MAIRVRTVMFSILVLLVLLLVGAITAVGWQVVLGPKMRAVTARHFDPSPVRLERGKYIVESVASCFHCHSGHDLSTPEYLTADNQRGEGWELPIPELGSIVAPNITPDKETGIGTWTDDEIARAIQEGVDKDGRALFPVMPWMNFRQMTDEDLASVVVYLRSIPPLKHVVPVTKLVFPLSLIVKTIPQPLVTPVAQKTRTTPAERGEYLMTVGGCRDCHTTQDSKGTPLPGMDLAGGNMFHDPADPSKHVFSQNITMDASGIAHYDEAFFIQTLRAGRLPGRTLTHIMPFENYRNMTDEDLAAIFAYIQTLPHVQHRVTNTDTPALCPLDGQTHGLGAMNKKKGS
jgi:mono/diheme cytochrome c family protein